MNQTTNTDDSPLLPEYLHATALKDGRDDLTKTHVYFCMDLDGEPEDSAAEAYFVISSHDTQGRYEHDQTGFFLTATALDVFLAAAHSKEAAEDVLSWLEHYAERIREKHGLTTAE